MVRAGGQDGRHGVGYVIAQYRREAAVVGWAADYAVRADHVRDEVHVEVHAREDPGQSGPADVILGREVLAAERERRVAAADEREVDDTVHAGVHRGIDGREVLLEPVRR